MLVSLAREAKAPRTMLSGDHSAAPEACRHLIGGQATRRRDLIIPTVMIVALLAACLQEFFIAYRIALFKVESYDDYARYLLFILSEPGGAVPPSPFIFRIGSVILASPFYYLPTIPLNGGSTAELVFAHMNYSAEDITAMQAICAASAASVGAACVSTYLYLRSKLGHSREMSFVGAGLLFVMTKFMSLTTVDGISTLPVTLLAISIFERRLILFIILAAASALLNEKILLVAFFIVSLRLLISRDHRRFYFLATLSSVAILSCIVAVIYAMDVPGADNQRNASTYLPAAQGMLKDLFTPKGLYRNLWPTLLLIGLWLVALAVPRHLRIAQVSDVGAVIGLLATAFALDVKYNVGRIVVYSAPIFVIAATHALAALSLQQKARSAELAELTE